MNCNRYIKRIKILRDNWQLKLINFKVVANNDKKTLVLEITTITYGYKIILIVRKIVGL